MTLACMQWHGWMDGWMDTKQAHVPKQRYPKQSQGALEQQFLVKLFNLCTWTLVHTQHCCHRETQQSTRQRVALGTHRSLEVPAQTSALRPTYAT